MLDPLGSALPSGCRDGPRVTLDKCPNCGKRWSVPVPEALTGHDHMTGHECRDGGATIQVTWEGGPSLTEVADQITETGWEREHQEGTLWLLHPDGEKVQLVRYHTTQTLLLAVAHHVIDVLPQTGEDEEEWLEDAANGGPAAEQLHDWHRSTPHVSEVAQIAAQLLYDQVGKTHFVGRTQWAASCWLHLGARYRHAAESILT